MKDMSVMNDEGGSAFPQVESYQEGQNGEYWTHVESVGGMSLRDYFAAKAMQAILSRPCAGGQTLDWQALNAKMAYAAADAMLAARMR